MKSKRARDRDGFDTISFRASGFNSVSDGQARINALRSQLPEDFDVTKESIKPNDAGRYTVEFEARKRTP